MSRQHEKLAIRWNGYERGGGPAASDTSGETVSPDPVRKVSRAHGTHKPRFEAPVPGERGDDEAEARRKPAHLTRTSYSFARRSRSALVMTETLLSAMATPANIGFRSHPNTG
jgi:hypothetical protein